MLSLTFILFILQHTAEIELKSAHHPHVLVRVIAIFLVATMEIFYLTYFHFVLLLCVRRALQYCM